MEGHSIISADLLGSYAGDAACEVAGVRGLVESTLPRHSGVRVSETDGVIGVELHVAVDWGSDVLALGAAVQERVRGYLVRMADVTPDAVDVVVEEIGPAPG